MMESSEEFLFKALGPGEGGDESLERSMKSRVRLTCVGFCTVDDEDEGLLCAEYCQMKKDLDVKLTYSCSLNSKVQV